MMKKKKQSRSQSSTKEPSPDSSSPSPRLLSVIRSKLVSGKDLKHMFRGMRTKTAPGLSSQSRIVRCPKCHKLLQEPIDATIYKCSGCNSILQAKRWEFESNGDSIPEALLYSQNRSLSKELKSAAGGSETPMRSTYRKYSSRASPSVERGYHSETVYKHETSESDIRREWMRKADEFSVAGDSARSSPYNSRSNAATEWTQHERRYQEPPQVPFYPDSPSPSSAYEYGYSSPFHGSQASASEQSYYHHQPNQFKQKDREGWFQESYAASPIRFPGETSDKKYYPSSSQSQLHDPRYHNIHVPSSSATSHRSVYSESSYQADTAQHRSQYSKHPKSGTSSEKRSQRDKKKYVRKKKPVVKRYVLPSAGGAPFATCSYCLELLQLPQVSLHGKHKMYQVRCGSCSGVLKFSVRDKEGAILDSPSFAEETVTNHQDSASEGHEEIYPDDSHLSCSDNGSRDRICKSNDAVNIETFEDKGSKEDSRSISSPLFDSKLEALQPSLNHKLREQRSASSESIGDTSRNHVEQSEEACSEKSTDMDNNIPERDSCGIEEAGLYEKNEILKPEGMSGDVSGESLEVSVCKNERMSDSSKEVEKVADTPVSHSGEPNEYVCETRVLSPEKNGDTQEFGWEETQEKEEYGGEGKWEDIMGHKPGYIEDSICDSSSSSNGEIYEETAVKEDTKHISAAPHNENQMFIGHPNQSGEATVKTFRIQEEQSKYEYENLGERQELDSDRVRYELDESKDETNEALDTDKVSEDGSVVSLTKASETFKISIEGETGEERSVPHQMDPPNENGEDSYEIIEYAGERTWAETLEDRSVLHLEEYERTYSKPFEWNSEGAPAFHIYEDELGTMNEPEEDADGRLESSSRGSFSDHESSEDSAVFQESQDAKSEYEIPSERQELSNTVVDTVRHEIQEDRYETNETFEQANLVGDGYVVSLEKANETNVGETGEERSVSHQMAPQNENLEAMGDEAELQLEEYHINPHEWTSERAPTFRLHEYELGTMHASEENADGRSESSSTDFANDHESSKEKAVADEEPLLVDENKIEELTVTLMVEDGPSPHLEQSGNDSTKLEETLEWTTERAPTFPLHDSELGTKLEPNEDADGRSESSSKEIDIDHEEEEEEEESRLVTDNRTKAQGEDEVAKDMVSLHLEECENESTKLDQTFEWTSERVLTFRHREYEPGTLPEPDQENIPASKMAVVDSDTEEDLEHLQKENDKSGLTSEPYSHFYNTTDPSEIVGLRLALYETQTSPLSSPMHTPIGSPLHILMRSPIASPMNSHIVSPMRSPINSSGSLSDVLFFSKKSLGQ